MNRELSRSFREYYTVSMENYFIGEGELARSSPICVGEAKV